MPICSSFARTRVGVAVVGLVTALGVGGCGVVGSSEASLDTVTIGSANFTESQVLAEIYAQALEAQDIQVERQFNIGAREAYMNSIEGDNPSINVMPEYVGYLLDYYTDDAPKPSVQGVVDQLKQELPDELALYDVSKATNEDAFVVTQQTADQHNLETIGDLKPVADQMVVGGGPEFEERRAGVQGMENVYGVHFKSFQTLDTGGPISLKALLNDRVQVTNFFTTQSTIKENNLVILKDPKGIIPPGNVVPLVRDDIPQEDTVQETLNEVQAALTTDKLTEMNRRVDVDEDPVKAVASDFLKSEGLV